MNVNISQCDTDLYFTLCSSETLQTVTRFALGVIFVGPSLLERVKMMNFLYLADRGLMESIGIVL